MTATARLRKVGGSTMVAIPPAILDALELGAESLVELSVDDGALTVRPSRPRYRLADLLAEAGGTAETADAGEAWTTSGPVGDELI
jgi:antitoxin ChpS